MDIKNFDLIIGIWYAILMNTWCDNNKKKIYILFTFLIDKYIRNNLLSKRFRDVL